MKNKKYLYKTKDEGKEIEPEFIHLDKVFLDKKTFEMCLELKERFGLPTISDLVNVAIHYIEKNKDYGNRLSAITKNIHTEIDTLNKGEEHFTSQKNLHILEQITEDTWGGVEH